MHTNTSRSHQPPPCDRRIFVGRRRSRLGLNERTNERPNSPPSTTTESVRPGGGGGHLHHFTSPTAGGGGDGDRRSFVRLWEREGEERASERRAAIVWRDRARGVAVAAAVVVFFESVWVVKEWLRRRRLLARSLSKLDLEPGQRSALSSFSFLYGSLNRPTPCVFARVRCLFRFSCASIPLLPLICAPVLLLPLLCLCLWPRASNVPLETRGARVRSPVRSIV